MNETYEENLSRFHARDTMIAAACFDLWQHSYRMLHALNMDTRALHYRGLRQAFDQVAAFIGEDISANPMEEWNRRMNEHFERMEAEREREGQPTATPAD